MKFVLRIAPMGRITSVTCMHETMLGFDYLDRVKDELKQVAPDLTTAAILDKLYDTRDSDILIELDEKVARRSGRFGKSSRITVRVEDYVHEFLEIRYTLARDERSGAINMVLPEWRLNAEEFLSVWAKMGYPLEWPKEEEEDDEGDNDE